MRNVSPGVSKAVQRGRVHQPPGKVRYPRSASAGHGGSSVTCRQGDRHVNGGADVRPGRGSSASVIIERKSTVSDKVVETEHKGRALALAAKPVGQRAVCVAVQQGAACSARPALVSDGRCHRQKWPRRQGARRGRREIAQAPRSSGGRRSQQGERLHAGPPAVSRQSRAEQRAAGPAWGHDSAVRVATHAAKAQVDDRCALVSSRLRWVTSASKSAGGGQRRRARRTAAVRRQTFCWVVIDAAPRPTL